MPISLPSPKPADRAFMFVRIADGVVPSSVQIELFGRPRFARNFLRLMYLDHLRPEFCYTKSGQVRRFSILNRSLVSDMSTGDLVVILSHEPTTKSLRDVVEVVLMNLTGVYSILSPFHYMVRKMVEYR